MSANKYIHKVETFYNKYVDFYNAEKSKLKAFSELSNIHTGLNEIKRLKKKRIKQNADRTIEMFLIAWVYETNDRELTFFECMDVVEEMESTDLKETTYKLLNDVHGVKSINQTQKEITNNLKEIFEYSEKGQITSFLNIAIENLEELQKITPNFHALTSLMEKITSLEYPETVSCFSELSARDQDTITRVGRPLNDDLPQSDIEEFVTNKLFPNGEKTNDKKFIHATGKWMGEPNWNQLALKYFDENPEVELNDVMSKRQLVKRIKKAYEVIITS